MAARLPLVLLLAAMVATATAAPPSAHGTSAAAAERASAAAAALMLHYWQQGSSALAAAWAPAAGQSGGQAAYWVTAEAVEALLDVAEATADSTFLGAAGTVLRGQIASATSLRASYYDDASWMANALLRYHVLTDEAWALEWATDLLTGVVAGWDATCCGANPGGVWWDVAHTQKSAPEHGSGALALARLAAITNSTAALNWAVQIFQFWADHFVLPSGQVIDHEDRQGQLTTWVFTYNQGVMLQAAAWLARVTGNATYCTAAHPLLDFMLSNLTSSQGVLSDGNATQCGGDCTLFKGIGVRGLVAYAAVCNATSAATLVQHSVDSLWNNARDLASNAFSVDWSGPPPNMSASQYIGSAIAALAGLGSAASLPSSTTSAVAPVSASSVVIEAEEGVLTNLGYEAVHGNFSGWAYIAGWRSDGQSVEYTLSSDLAAACSCSSGSSCTLTLRYAGESAAHRRLVQDQMYFAAPLNFTGTGSYDVYGWTAPWPLRCFQTPLSINVRHSLTLEYQAGIVNLDALQIDVQPA